MNSVLGVGTVFAGMMVIGAAGCTAQLNPGSGSFAVTDGGASGSWQTGSASSGGTSSSGASSGGASGGRTSGGSTSPFGGTPSGSSQAKSPPPKTNPTGSSSGGTKTGTGATPPKSGTGATTPGTGATPSKGGTGATNPGTGATPSKSGTGATTPGTGATPSKGGTGATNPGTGSGVTDGMDGGTGADPCANATADGTYCGSTLQTGDADTLYTCSSSATESSESCPDGCAADPSGQGDSCSTDTDGGAAGDPCANAPNDGSFCGSSLQTGDADTLYTCSSSATESSESCPDGCAADPSGQGDSCANDPSGGGSSDDPCANASDGQYCGSSIGAGDADTLYDCASGVTQSSQACSNGCADDACN